MCAIRGIQLVLLFSVSLTEEIKADIHPRMEALSQSQ